MKYIRCCVWKDIPVSELALKIIDTEEFQRLHHIKQCGLLYKVFPSSTHTRFQHSLGVYHCTNLLIRHLQENSRKKLNITDRQKELISIVALCHDLGHGPFSHLFDLYLQKQYSPSIEIYHEERSCSIFRSIVEKYRLPITKDEINFICKCIVSPSDEVWYENIVNNSICCFDTDKLDYLLRDSMMVGFPRYFDIDRVFRNVILEKNQILFCHKIKYEIENMFSMRENLYKIIYRHPVVEKCQMFLLDKMLKKDLKFNMEFFLELNDERLLQLVFNKEERAQFEKREWKHLDEKETKEFKDDQKERAMKNIIWY